MKATKIGNLVLLLASIGAFTGTPAFAADPVPRPIVVVTPNPVTEGQSVQLRIEIESNQSQPVFQPKFDAPDFLMVGASYGGNSSSTYFSGQSVTTKKSFFEWVLSPKKAGSFYIRNIRLKVGQQEISSPDVMVKVLPDTSPPSARHNRNDDEESGNPFPGFPNLPPGFNDDDDEAANPAAPGYQGGNAPAPSPDQAPDSFNSDFTVFASLSKHKAYVGEPIVVEYWLYDFGGLRQVEVQKWPAFNGFWKDDLEITSRFEFDEVVAGGRMARRAFISRYALYGIKPGKINIDKLVIRGQYVSRTAGQGFFQTQELRTGIHGNQDLNVEILPLPTEGQPDKFGGAVGQFFLKAEADKTTVPQHTPVTFTVTLQGTGNFQAIDTIRLPLPADFELYESKTASKDAPAIGVRRELSAQKTFQITAVPRKAGKFRVEPITWWYFNPQKGSYQKLSTNPIDIEVTENAAGAQGTNTYATPSSGGSGPSATAAELRPLKSLDSLEFHSGKPWLWTALGLLALLNIWLGFRRFRGRAEKYVGTMFGDPLAEAKKELARAKGAKDGTWLSALEDSLYSMGEVLLGANPRGITRTELESQWREQNLPGALFNRLALVLDRLDQSRFSTSKNSDQSQRLKLQQEVEDILRDAGKAKKK